MIPSVLTVGELAKLSGLSVDQIRYQADRGGLPFRRATANPRSRRLFSIVDIKRLMPDVYEKLIDAEVEALGED